MARLKRKPPFRREAVMAHIRDRIRSGELRPGDRLPTRSEIETRCAAPPRTVQAAFDRLVEEGFVVVDGRKGSFVAERPPHRHRLVLAIVGVPGEDGWVELWSRVDAAWRDVATRRGLWLDVVYGVQRGCAGEAQLSREVGDGRVAGMLFASNPHECLGTACLEAPGPQRLALMRKEGPDGVMPFHLDSRSVYDRVLDDLVEHRIRRPAFLLPELTYDESADWLAGEVAARGMAADRHLRQIVSAGESARVEQLVHLLLALPARRRPDALVVGDDNLLPAVRGTLAESGAAAGIRVLVQANFPVARREDDAVAAIGFSIPEVVDAAVDALLGAIAGRPLPGQRFRAYRADEVDPSGRPIVC